MLLDAPLAHTHPAGTSVRVYPASPTPILPPTSPIPGAGAGAKTGVEFLLERRQREARELAEMENEMRKRPQAAAGSAPQRSVPASVTPTAIAPAPAPASEPAPAAAPASGFMSSMFSGYAPIYASATAPAFTPAPVPAPVPVPVTAPAPAPTPVKATAPIPPPARAPVAAPVPVVPAGPVTHGGMITLLPYQDKQQEAAELAAMAMGMGGAEQGGRQGPGRGQEVPRQLQPEPALSVSPVLVTTLSTPAPRGSSRLDVASQAGAAVGMTAVVGSGMTVRC